MNKIYLATKMIGDAYSAQVVNQNEGITAWLAHKLKHSFGVSLEIMNILYGEKEICDSLTKDEKELVELSGILHDLGRFYQHKDGRHLSNSEFDHGEYAVKLLKDNPNFNNPIILFAIQEHNQIAIRYDNPYYTELSDHDKKVADITAKLLRDADKLENIKQFIYEGHPKLTYEITHEPMSEYVKNCVINNFQISNKIIKNTVDRIVGLLSWVHDINYETTKIQVRNLHYIEAGINEAITYGATAEDCELLRKYLKV